MYERFTIKDKHHPNCDVCKRSNKACSPRDCNKTVYECLEELENQIENGKFVETKDHFETNRDWFNSLSNAEIAWMFFSNESTIFKYFNRYNIAFEVGVDKRYGNSVKAFLYWLNAEYSKDSKVYEYLKTGIIPEEWISPIAGCFGKKSKRKEK